jgi:hypothetical protein
LLIQIIRLVHQEFNAFPSFQHPFYKDSVKYPSNILSICRLTDIVHHHILDLFDFAVYLFQSIRSRIRREVFLIDIEILEYRSSWLCTFCVTICLAIVLENSFSP